MLIVQNISKSFDTPAGPLPILQDIHLTLEPGQSLAIMGSSGSGKSTLLNIIGTLEAPTAGTIHLFGEQPFTLHERDLARFRNQRIGFVFQEHHLLPHLSVMDNVCLPAMAGFPVNINVRERATQLLAHVGLTHRSTHLPAHLSGGERQRTVLARALLLKPAVILADEPTGNLDQASADTVTDLLCSLADKERAMLIIVTHSDTVAARCQQIMEIRNRTLLPRTAHAALA